MTVTLDELRRLTLGVEPIAFDEAPQGSEPRVVAFNGVVSRFRELVVAARNQMVQGRPVPPELGVEIRALSDALPEERRRATVAGPREPGPSPSAPKA
jgi:hypothetical protein